MSLKLTFNHFHGVKSIIMKFSFYYFENYLQQVVVFGGSYRNIDMTRR